MHYITCLRKVTKYFYKDWLSVLVWEGGLQSEERHISLHFRRTFVDFRSPEHEVLKVSYCDRDVSVVFRPSCGVHRASSTFYLVYALEATFSVRYSWNFVSMFAFMKSRMSPKLGHVGSKTRSLGQILEQLSLPSRSHIFNLILMKLGQNVCLDKLSDEFENGSCSVKNLVIS